MKHLIFIVCCLAIYASAELPANIPDQKVRDSVEYVDGKVNKAYSVTKKFESATSTVSVSGYIDVGRQSPVTSGCSGCTTVTATCAAGYYIMYGGCEADTGTPYLKVNRASSTSAWLCSSAGATNLTAYVTCGRIK